MQLSPSPLSFKDCYKPKTSWTDDNSYDVPKMLRSFYPSFYDAETHELLTSKLQNQLRNLNAVGKSISQEDKKAVELFKELSRFPFTNAQSKSCIQHPTLQNIVSEFGDRILAHGVEEPKGGICCLFMMALCQKVLVPTSYWGPLKPGLPNLFSLPHGPYYVVHSVRGDKPHKPLVNNQPFESIDCILLPFEEIKEEVLKSVQNLLDIGLFDTTVANAFCAKLKTYDEYYQELLLNHRPQALIISSSPAKIKGQVKTSSGEKKENKTKRSELENEIETADCGSMPKKAKHNTNKL